MQWLDRLDIKKDQVKGQEKGSDKKEEEDQQNVSTYVKEGEFILVEHHGVWEQWMIQEGRCALCFFPMFLKTTYPNVLSTIFDPKWIALDGHWTWVHEDCFLYRSCYKNYIYYNKRDHYARADLLTQKLEEKKDILCHLKIDEIPIDVINSLKERTITVVRQALRLSGWTQRTKPGTNNNKNALHSSDMDTINSYYNDIYEGIQNLLTADEFNEFISQFHLPKFYQDLENQDVERNKEEITYNGVKRKHQETFDEPFLSSETENRIKKIKNNQSEQVVEVNPDFHPQVQQIYERKEN